MWVWMSLIYSSITKFTASPFIFRVIFATYLPLIHNTSAIQAPFDYGLVCLGKIAVEKWIMNGGFTGG